MPDDEPIVRDLGEALLDAIDEFSRHRRLTRGNAMGALFGVFITTAQEAPDFDPEKFKAEVNSRLDDLT